jgi:Phage integrase, N-terminal SAM-like domain
VRRRAHGPDRTALYGDQLRRIACRQTGPPHTCDRQRLACLDRTTPRNRGKRTQSDYIRAVKSLARFLGRSPDTAGREDLRLFQLHLTESRVGAPTINSTVSGVGAAILLQRDARSGRCSQTTDLRARAAQAATGLLVDLGAAFARLKAANFRTRLKIMAALLAQHSKGGEAR